jgi:hypothetical protein
MQISISRPNSSGKKMRGTLAGSSPAKEAKELLEGVVNLGDDDFGWFQRRFPYVLEELTPRIVSMETEYGDSEEFPFNAPLGDDKSKFKYWLLPLRATLRAIWRAPDRRTKRWGMFRVSQDFFLQGDHGLLHVPLENSADDVLSGLKAPTRTELLLLHFTRWSDLTRYCDNPECSSPYFIARDPRQKYCSDACAKPAQRECKRNWWAKHGRQQRATKKSRPK